MLCLSGFELYSRWVPLFINELSNFVVCLNYHKSILKRKQTDIIEIRKQLGKKESDLPKKPCSTLSMRFNLCDYTCLS